jgi:hypothetical protein
MAKKERFYQGPVDRTPYGSCAVVAIIAGIFFLGLATELVRAGGTIQHWLAKQHPSTTVSLPTENPFSSAQQQLDSIQQKASDQVQEKIDQQKAEAEAQAKAAAQQEVKQQIDTLKDQLP